MFIVVNRWDPNETDSKMDLIGRYNTLEEAKRVMKEDIEEYMGQYINEVDYLLDTWSDDGLNCVVDLEDEKLDVISSVHWGILEV